MVVYLFCCCFVVILRQSNTPTVFRLYLGSDMMYEMRRRKPEPTLLPTEVIFILPHHTGMVSEGLAFDDAVSYA